MRSVLFFFLSIFIDRFHPKPFVIAHVEFPSYTGDRPRRGQDNFCDTRAHTRGGDVLHIMNRYHYITIRFVSRGSYTCAAETRDEAKETERHGERNSQRERDRRDGRCREIDANLVFPVHRINVYNIRVYLL